MILNKRILIISPHFPPINAADMHRVRLSLPNFSKFGWEAEVVMVKQKFVDLSKDQMLLESLPTDLKIHEVKAFKKELTSKIGLGSLALRSIYFYKKYVNDLLKRKHFDLILFSTTEFPLCVLGTYWQKKFKIPFVIDMQDPWHTEYYESKPKSERPPKYWFSYNLNKFLEPIAMRKVNGIISVSEKYIYVLQHRYKNINKIPSKVITFPAAELDFEIAELHSKNLKTPLLNNSHINLVYIGRGGFDLNKSATLLFETFKEGLESNFELFKNVRFYFIGTSYAPEGKGKKTIMPIAKQFGFDNYVVEQTDRIPYYESIAYLKKANGLIILGSDDESYTASKIFPYILAKRPLLAIFNLKSSAAHIIKNCNAGVVSDINAPLKSDILIETFLNKITSKKPIEKITDWKKFSMYSALELTRQQCKLFDLVLQNG